MRGGVLGAEVCRDPFGCLLHPSLPFIRSGGWFPEQPGFFLNDHGIPQAGKVCVPQDPFGGYLYNHYYRQWHGCTLGPRKLDDLL